MSLRVTEDEYVTLKARTSKGQSVTPAKPSAKRNKFGATPTTAHGFKFHSKGEARRYGALLMQEQAGLIRYLRRQVRYRLVVNGITICVYVADFVYFEKGKRVIEDYKGMRTPEYKIKAKLFKALSGVTIRETSR